MGTTSANVSVQVTDSISGADALKSLEQRPTTAELTTAEEFASEGSQKGAASEEATIKKKKKAKEEKQADKKSIQISEVREEKRLEEESKVPFISFVFLCIIYYIS